MDMDLPPAALARAVGPRRRPVHQRLIDDELSNAESGPVDTYFETLLQRNIIGERLLGLRREPNERPDDVRWVRTCASSGIGQWWELRHARHVDPIVKGAGLL